MDLGALQEQLEALHPSSFAWALACCGRRADEAEEVLQNVYLKIIEGKARFDGKSTLKTWLFSVIRRTAAEHFRWRRLRFFATPVKNEETADARMERNETIAQIVRALGQLSTRQREVLHLVFYQEMTIEQAAETLGLSLGSARVHYERGKRRLAERLKKEVRVVFA